MKRFRTGLIGATALALSFAATAQSAWYPSKWGAADETSSNSFHGVSSGGMAVNDRAARSM